MGGTESTARVDMHAPGEPGRDPSEGDKSPRPSRGPSPGGMRLATSAQVSPAQSALSGGIASLSHSHRDQLKGIMDPHKNPSTPRRTPGAPALVPSIFGCHNVVLKGEDGARAERLTIGNNVLTVCLVVDGHGGAAAAGYVIANLVSSVAKAAGGDASTASLGRRRRLPDARLSPRLAAIVDDVGDDGDAGR